MFVVFFILFIGLIIIGFNYYTSGQARGDNRKTKVGNSLMATPFILFGLFILILFVYQKISFKPNKNDMAGLYEIEDVSNLEINENDFKNYKLELLKNGSFKFINKPNINVCDKGKYKLLYDENEGELLIKCDYLTSSAKIVSNLNSFEIKFEIGDPDSGESICYKKIEN